MTTTDGRLPYAARTLEAQVRETSPDAEIDYDDLDGLGVYRKLRFDKDVSADLAPALAIAADSRIVEQRVTDDGYLHVTFSPEIKADLDGRFPLEAAYEMVAERASGEPDEKGEGQPEKPSGPRKRS